MTASTVGSTVTDAIARVAAGAEVRSSADFEPIAVSFKRTKNILRQAQEAGHAVGNEVNSRWYWSNMGRVSMEQFAQDYLRTVRICHTAVRKFSSSARVFISLGARYPAHFYQPDLLPPSVIGRARPNRLTMSRFPSRAWGR